jgi:hypothetical protein
MSSLLERVAWVGCSGWAGCLSGLLSDWGFCISQSSPPPNITQAQFVFHQPPFLSLSMASVMKFNSCESATFINPRMHAGYTKSHDPINDHMTTTEVTLLFVNFLLFDCCVNVMVVVACYWFEIWCLRCQMTVIKVSLWVTMTSMYFTTQRTFDDFSKCELSESCRSQWAACLSHPLRVSRLLERPAHKITST